jgi:hypothetical protein
VQDLNHPCIRAVADEYAKCRRKWDCDEAAALEVLERLLGGYIPLLESTGDSPAPDAADEALALQPAGWVVEWAPDLGDEAGQGESPRRQVDWQSLASSAEAARQRAEADWGELDNSFRLRPVLLGPAAPMEAAAARAAIPFEFRAPAAAEAACWSAHVPRLAGVLTAYDFPAALAVRFQTGTFMHFDRGFFTREDAADARRGTVPVVVLYTEHHGYIVHPADEVDSIDGQDASAHIDAILAQGTAQQRVQLGRGWSGGSRGDDG